MRKPVLGKKQLRRSPVQVVASSHFLKSCTGSALRSDSCPDLLFLLFLNISIIIIGTRSSLGSIELCQRDFERLFSLLNSSASSSETRPTRLVPLLLLHQLLHFWAFVSNRDRLTEWHKMYACIHVGPQGISSMVGDCSALLCSALLSPCALALGGSWTTPQPDLLMQGTRASH